MQLVTLRAPMGSRPTAADNLTTLSGLVMPWGETFTRAGVPMAFHADSITIPDDLSAVKLLVEHDPERPIGTATAARPDAAGLHMEFRLADHDRSRDAAHEITERLRDGYSVGVALSETAIDAVFSWEPGGDPVPLSGTLREVSLVAIPQMQSARVEQSAPPLVTLSQKVEPMDTPTAAAAAADFTITEAPEFLELAGRVARLETTGPSGSHPAARFATLGAAIKSGTGADPMESVTLALADNVADNGTNAGVVPPAWLSGVVGIINRRRAAVNAFGGPGPLPASGLSIDWPYYDGDLSQLVGKQTAHKSEITSAVVDIKRATADIVTYAGGADNALQLIERSSPAFLSEWGRIMAAAYGLVTETDFTGKVAAGAGETLPIDWGTATAETVKAWLFAASDAVDDATGAPAGFCLASPDVFQTIGTLDGIYPGEYGTTNTAGTASAATLRVDVNGLPIIKARGLAAGTAIVSNSDAARFHESGPRFIDALNVSRLGRDSAIYGYGVARIITAAGIVKSGPVGP